MTAPTADIILAAGDGGPLDTLRPLVSAIGAMLPDAPPATAALDDYWRDLIRSCSARGVVCGTSDSAAGRAAESAARRAAARAGIPAVAIEDFPGNYYHVPGGPVGLLLVESDAVAGLARPRFGTACPPVEALSPVRYDAYRRDARALRACVRERWSDAQSRPAALWAGQPETADCVRTLRALLPLVRERSLQVLFKAHPRDAGRSSGVYPELFGEFHVGYRDVTGLTVPDTLSLAPRLAVTQFSSVAIEAGFYGIPGLNVLLPDAGGPRLLSKKGYAVPPHCEHGAAAHVIRSEDLAAVFARTLDDRAERENIMRCFDAYFSTATAVMPALVARLRRFFGWQI